MFVLICSATRDRSSGWDGCGNGQDGKRENDAACFVCSITRLCSNCWTVVVMVVGTVTPMVGTVTEDDGDVTLTCWMRDTAVMAGTVSEDVGAMFCLNSPGNETPQQ